MADEKLKDIEKALERHRKLGEANAQFWSRPSEVKESDELHARAGAKPVRKYYKTRVYPDGSMKRQLVKITREDGSPIRGKR